MGRDLRAVTWLIFSMGFFVLAILSEMGVLGPLLSVLGIYCFIGILSIIVMCWIGAVIYNLVHEATGSRLGTIEEAILKLAAIETALEKAKNTMNEMKENASTFADEMKTAAGKLPDDFKNAANDAVKAAYQSADEMKKDIEQMVCCC